MITNEPMHYPDVMPGVSLDRIPDGVPPLQATFRTDGVGTIAYFVINTADEAGFVDKFRNDPQYAATFLSEVGRVLNGTSAIRRYKYLTWVTTSDIGEALLKPPSTLTYALA